MEIAEIRPMLTIIAMVAVIVCLAMIVDLIAGLYKAYLRGDARRSEALKRTGYKFCLYQGSILIAAGIDVLIHLSRLYKWFSWEIIYGLPLVTIFLGIFWCIVEFLSVREKADEKTHSDIAKAESVAAMVIKIIKNIKSADKELIAEAISEALEKEKDSGESQSS